MNIVARRTKIRVLAYDCLLLQGHPCHVITVHMVRQNAVGTHHEIPGRPDPGRAVDPCRRIDASTERDQQQTSPAEEQPRTRAEQEDAYN
jgi:hypothetical protein